MDKINYSITCSNLAAEKALEQINKRNKLGTLGIRLGIRGAGCNGYMLAVEFADKQLSEDYIFEFNGVKFYIDAKSIIYLNGTHIDYKVGLMKSGFDFNIPNKIGECGCGTSLSFNLGDKNDIQE